MKKSELNHFLKIYHLLSKSVNDNDFKTKIIIYGRIREIEIPKWLSKIEEVFMKIVAVENNKLIEEIIDKSYRKGFSDKRLISKLPITESGYYRLKKKIEQKIYEMYIVLGSVTEKEILENKVFQ